MEMENIMDTVIVSTINALANGMSKSWIDQDFIKEFKRITGWTVDVENIHGVHKAAKKALKATKNLRLGWTTEHVVVLMLEFAARLKVEW